MRVAPFVVFHTSYQVIFPLAALNFIECEAHVECTRRKKYLHGVPGFQVSQCTTNQATLHPDEQPHLDTLPKLNYVALC
jgi:hypothetical protein